MRKAMFLALAVTLAIAACSDAAWTTLGYALEQASSDGVDLTRIDWIAHYKHRPPIQRLHYVPAYSPTMEWAVPNSALQGPPAGPAYPVSDWPGYGYPPAVPEKEQ